MFTSKMTRRGFLVGCSAAIAGMAGARVGNIAFAAPQANGLAVADGERDILVVIFLRGGWDVLSVLPPIDGPDRGFYERARPQLAVPRKGPGAALPLKGMLGLHPKLAPLHDLYTNGSLAIVQAAGLQHDTRSHFDAMEFMELGTPGIRNGTSGWITRHLRSAPASASALVSTVGLGYQPTAMLGDDHTVAVSNIGDMKLPGDESLRAIQREALRALYHGEEWVHRAGQQTLSAIDAFRSATDGDYKTRGDAEYPQNEFGNSMKSVAQMLSLNLGVQALSVDYGGWDTHDNQAADGGEGHLPDMLGVLAQGIAAFYKDIEASGLAKKVTVVTMSEFGRRLVENESRGTDHGHGSAMFVLGGNVNGGLYGRWPGLASEQLFEGADLAVTTDFRQVLGEIVTRRLRNPNLEQVFPGYTGYAPLGIFK